MFRRSVLQFRKLQLRASTQVPSYLSSRAFSLSQKNVPHNPQPKSGRTIVIAGGVVVVGASLALYNNGLLDKYLGEEHRYKQIPKNNTQELSETSRFHQDSELQKAAATDVLEASDTSSPSSDPVEGNVESHSEKSLPEGSVTAEAVSNSQMTDTVSPSQENIDQVEERKLPDVPESSMPSDDTIIKPAEESLDLKSPEVKPDEEQDKAIKAEPITKTTGPTGSMPDEVAINTVSSEEITTNDVQEAVQDDGTQSSSLLGDYLLKDSSEDISADSSSKEKGVISKTEDPSDGYISKDGVFVLDFLQAIHAAEERQAEIDARSFAEERRAIKEKYEKEIKDARVRELMYAEREAILDKELTKERVKAAAALKSLQEKLEEKLKIELEQKEIEVEQTLKKLQDIAKAELAAAIASEKASQIEKMAEANLHINALCMAFYARSEEARQSHSIHKLAIGTLALEDALTKGLPVEREMQALHTHLEGADKESLITLVISSLPEDTRKCGTDTLPQLNHKFNELKGTLRHFSLIPPGGGGILTHSLAHIASLLKVKEADQSGDGTESLINKVENLLAQGKLSEAADALENGVKGSQAAEVVNDWVKRARNRAITEQALTVLQSYATSISLT